MALRNKKEVLKTLINEVLDERDTVEAFDFFFRSVSIIIYLNF